jgi:hypothetical protein
MDAQSRLGIQSFIHEKRVYCVKVKLELKYNRLSSLLAPCMEYDISSKTFSKISLKIV